MDWIVGIVFWFIVLAIGDFTPVDKWSTTWKITFGNICGCVLMLILKYL